MLESVTLALLCQEAAAAPPPTWRRWEAKLASSWQFQTTFYELVWPPPANGGFGLGMPIGAERKRGPRYTLTKYCTGHFVLEAESAGKFAWDGHTCLEFDASGAFVRETSEPKSFEVAAFLSIPGLRGTDTPWQRGRADTTIFQGKTYDIWDERWSGIDGSALHRWAFNPDNGYMNSYSQKFTFQATQTFVIGTIDFTPSIVSINFPKKPPPSK